MINKVLQAIIIILVSLITAVTIEVKLSSQSSVISELTESKKKELMQKNNSAFYEVGQVRLFTKKISDDDHTVLVCTPWLEYENYDNTFYEEINIKGRSIKSVITNYFINYSEHDLRTKGEQEIKETLIKQINNLLIMGEIKNLYFNDYQFID